MDIQKAKTYKEFGKYLRTVANLFATYGDTELEEGKEYENFFSKLSALHHDYDHGADRIEDLKDEFIFQCDHYGTGWINPNDNPNCES